MAKVRGLRLLWAEDSLALTSKTEKRNKKLFNTSLNSYLK